MHPDAYRTLAAIESTGWYYQARVRCVQRLIERFVVPRPANLEILDVGCGTGGTSLALGHYGHVMGLEPSGLAIELLAARYPRLEVTRGGVQDAASLFAPASFDVATVMGVLYHRDVPDPASALRQIEIVLKPGGWLIWNEGVYPILARAHDEFVEAGRRFRPSEMRTLLAGEGFHVRFGSHLLGWGFPIALALSAAHRARKRIFPARDYRGHTSNDRPLPRPINAALRELTYLEWACSLRHIKMPFGVSYLIIAQKPAE